MDDDDLYDRMMDDDAAEEEAAGRRRAEEARAAATWEAALRSWMLARRMRAWRVRRLFLTWAGCKAKNCSHALRRQTRGAPPHKTPSAARASILLHSSA